MRFMTEMQSSGIKRTLRLYQDITPSDPDDNENFHTFFIIEIFFHLPFLVSLFRKLDTIIFYARRAVIKLANYT